MKAIQWTVFIDMLGFSELNSTVDSDHKAKELMDFMSSNMSLMLNYEEFVRPAYEKDNAFNLYEWYEVKSAFISDSIVMTFKPREVVAEKNKDKVLMHSANALMLIALRLSALMHKCLSEKSIIFRGGISTGYCDIKDSFAVGEGLSFAHYTESKIAIYPRLVLSEDVVLNKKLLQKINWLYKEMYGEGRFIKREGAVVWVDVLHLLLASADPKSPSVKWQMSDYATRGKIILARTVLESTLSMQKKLVRDSISEYYAKYRSCYGDLIKRKLYKNILGKYFWLRRHHNSELQGRRYDEFEI